MLFPTNLYKLRISKALTITELSLYTNISITSLSAYERGLYKPSLENLWKLADFFQISLDRLVGRTF